MADTTAPVDEDVLARKHARHVLAIVVEGIPAASLVDGGRLADLTDSAAWLARYVLERP